MARPKNSRITLRILQQKAKEKYERALKLRPGETKEEWTDRTNLSRVRYEAEFKDLGVRIKNYSRPFKLSVVQLENKKLTSKKKYEDSKRILFHIHKKPFKFFQNSLIILSWAELKYGIERNDLLMLMYLYAEERPMVKEEILYKMQLFYNKNPLFVLNRFVDKGFLNQHVKINIPSIRHGLVDGETDLYKLSRSAVGIVSGLHKCMIGLAPLNKFKVLRKEYKHIDNVFDAIKTEIIDYKSGKLTPETFTNINEKE